MARYPVTCCRNNTNAGSTVQIVKITFDVYEETNAPSVTAAFDPATPGNGRTYTGPVTLNFSVDRSGQRRPGAAAGRRGLHRASRHPQRRPGPVGALDQPGPREPVHELDDGDRATAPTSSSTARPTAAATSSAIKSVSFWINRPTTTTPPAGKVSAIVPSTLGLAVNSTGARPVHPGRRRRRTPARRRRRSRPRGRTPRCPSTTRTRTHDDQRPPDQRRVDHPARHGRPEQHRRLPGDRQRDRQRTVATWATPVASAHRPRSRSVR